MRLPLPESIRGLVALIVGMALLPAIGLSLAAGYTNIQDGLAATEQQAAYTVRQIARHQTRLTDNTRTLLQALAQLREVRGADAHACTALFQNLLLHTPAYANLRLCDTSGNTIASADFEPKPLSPMERLQVAEASKLSSFSVQKVPSDARYGDDAALNSYYPVTISGNTVSVLVASMIFSVPSLEAFAEQPIDHLYITDRHGGLLYAYPEMQNPEYHDHSDEWTLVQGSSGRLGSLHTSGGSLIVYEKLISKGHNIPNLAVILVLKTTAVYSQVLQDMADRLILLVVFLAATVGTMVLICNKALLLPLGRLMRAAEKIKSDEQETQVNEADMPEELQQLAVSLNRMSAALAQRDGELITMRDAAAVAARAKTIFLANMSHEIRTPMNAVLGMTYLARLGELNPQQRGYLDTIHTEAEKLLEIINGILDFSKMEAGRMQLESIPFPLRQTLETAIQPAREEAEKKGIAFSFELAPALPPNAVGDALQLSRLIGNIVSGAVRATAEGGVHIACGTDRAGQEEFLLECRITDTGGGMPEDELAALIPLDPQTVAAQTPVMEGGHSLSIAFTRELARLMNATLHVSLKPEVGTTITVRVPLKSAAGTEPLPDQAADDAADDVAVPAGLHVLLVDDNPINLQVGEELLRSLGVDATTAGSGMQALDKLRAPAAAASFHMVFMDLQMPTLDGFAATAAIRADAELNKLPVIAMSAHAKDEEWERCKEFGINAYMTKPINVAHLRKILFRFAPCKDNAAASS